MRGRVLARSDVKKLLDQFVFVELWTDKTPWARQNAELLKSRFGSAALPLYATLGPDGTERSRLVGVAGAEEFIFFLNKGLWRNGKTAAGPQ